MSTSDRHFNPIPPVLRTAIVACACISALFLALATPLPSFANDQTSGVAASLSMDETAAETPTGNSDNSGNSVEVAISDSTDSPTAARDDLTNGSTVSVDVEINDGSTLQTDTTASNNAESTTEASTSDIQEKTSPIDTDSTTVADTEDTAENKPAASGDDTSAAILEDGTYIIETGVSDSSVVEVAGGSCVDGANVQIHSYNGSGAQQWQIAYDEETSYYRIVNVKSGKPLAVADGTLQNGTNVQIDSSSSAQSQLWGIVKAGAGYTLISALGSNFVLDVAGASAQDWTNVWLHRSNETNAQSFWFLAVNPDIPAGTRVIEDGCYTIGLSADSTKVLDIYDGGTSSGANVWTYASNSSMAQKFQFTYSEGFYTIMNVGSGLALDAEGAGIMPKTNVWQYTINGTDAQSWSIQENADGTYTLINRANGLALDIYGGLTASGTNVQVYRSNGTAAQRFLLTVADYLQDGLYAIRTNDARDVVVDVPNATADDVQLQLYTSNNTFAQKYQVVKVGTNVYTFKATASGNYLTVAGDQLVQSADASEASRQWTLVWKDGGLCLSSISTGTVVSLGGQKPASGTKLMTTANSSEAQAFRFSYARLIENGYYTIKSSVGDKVLDVAGGGRRSGTNVQIYTPNGTGAQTFLIENVGDFYLISNAASGRAVDVADGSTGDYANVQIFSKNYSDAQLWSTRLMAGCYIVFVNKGSGKALDVCGGVDEDSANVDIYSINGSAAQSWMLASTSYTPDNQVVLGVPCPWNQYDVGLPTGCESMALTNALLYWGFDLDPDTIADDYMPWSESDFVYAFLGNPHTYHGLTIMPPGLANTANAFLTAVGSSLGAYDITGISFSDLYAYIDGGYPVIVWNTVGMGSLGGNSYEQDGYTCHSNTHTVVLAGYNLSAGTVYISDSISGAVWRDASEFAAIYAAMGSLAVTIV